MFTLNAMKEKTSKTLFAFLYLLSFYLAIKLIPFEKLNAVSYLPSLLQVLSLFFLLLWIFHELRNSGLTHYKNQNHLNIFLLSPFLLICLSNILYCLIFHEELKIQMDISFIFTVLKTSFSVMIEEILFRVFFIEFLRLGLKESRWKNLLIIFFSSIAFSLLHVINFYGNPPLSVLLQIGYTFYLGLILGYIAIYFESPILPFICHFLFNFLNTDLYISLYDAEINTRYVLFSSILGIVLLIYFVLLYHLAWRKNKNGNFE